MLSYRRLYSNDHLLPDHVRLDIPQMDIRRRSSLFVQLHVESVSSAPDLCYGEPVFRTSMTLIFTDISEASKPPLHISPRPPTSIRLRAVQAVVNIRLGMERPRGECDVESIVDAVVLRQNDAIMCTPTVDGVCTARYAQRIHPADAPHALLRRRSGNPTLLSSERAAVSTVVAFPSAMI